MKKLIWIVGGMASGKSTLRDGLIEAFATEKPKLVANDCQEYVDAGRIASLGDCLRANQCNGLDSSFSRLKKDGALRNAQYLIQHFDITLIEGSQTSAQWILPLCEYCIENDCKFILIHLNLRLWENFLRLRTRLLASGKTERDITDEKLKSVAAKNSQAEFITKQCEKTEFVKVIRLDTEGMTTDDVLRKALSLV